MFKKRSKPSNASQVRQRPVDEPQDEPESGTLVSDLLALRRLKAEQAPGIEADKLNAGPGKKRKLSPAEGEQAQEQQQQAAESSGSGGLARKNNFTSQQNLIDVNKHMMDYIETEMRKRSGGDSEEVKEKKKDPRDELYEIDERYRENTGPLAEGNVTRSTTMLTAIPEVDLGIDVRLRNIEETERAKRSLYESEQAAAQAAGPTKAQVEADNYARQRFYQPEAREYGQSSTKKAVDYERDAAELLRQARKAAKERRDLGMEDELDDAAEAEVQEEVRKKVNELKSTDEQVVARYKNRQKENSGRQNKGIVFNR